MKPPGSDREPTDSSTAIAEAKARSKPGLDGVPNDAELEPGCGVPHRLGGAPASRSIRTGDTPNLTDSSMGVLERVWLSCAMGRNP